MLVDLLVPDLQYRMALNNSLSLAILVRLFLIEWIPSNRYTRFCPTSNKARFGSKPKVFKSDLQTEFLSHAFLSNWTLHILSKVIKRQKI